MTRARIHHHENRAYIDLSDDTSTTTVVVRFPGGSVEVSRTSDGDHWAHISVTTPYQDPEAPGAVVDARLECPDNRPDSHAEDVGPSLMATANHLALRIHV